MPAALGRQRRGRRAELPRPVVAAPAPCRPSSRADAHAWSAWGQLLRHPRAPVQGGKAAAETLLQHGPTPEAALAAAGPELPAFGPAPLGRHAGLGPAAAQAAEAKAAADGPAGYDPFQPHASAEGGGPAAAAAEGTALPAPPPAGAAAAAPGARPDIMRRERRAGCLRHCLWAPPTPCPLPAACILGRARAAAAAGSAASSDALSGGHEARLRLLSLGLSKEPQAGALPHSHAGRLLPLQATARPGC